jgi:hypothetical protein
MSIGFNFESERLALPQVAKLLKVHVATVWRWVLTGVRGKKLSTMMIGGRRYVLRADLETFLLPQAKQHLLNNDGFRRRAELAGKQLDAMGDRSANQAKSVRQERDS